MASNMAVLLKRSHVVARLPRLAATVEKGEAAVVVEAWDGSKSPTELQLFKLLTSLNAGEKPLPTYVHKAYAYSAAPQDLVNGRRHAPGTGHGKESSWYFHSQPAAGKEGKRNRKVGGEEDGTWHPEAGRKSISAVAYKRTFSYTVKSPPAMETASRQRTGWIMVEISLDKQTGAGADHMVLCVVYKSKKKYPDTSMAAAAPGCDGEASVHESVGLSGTDIPAVPKPAPSIDTAGTTKILLQKAAEKAASCHFEKVCEIKEFVDFKERHLRTIDQLGLDRPIISGSLRMLEVRLQHVAMDEILTPAERDHIVSCGEDMSTTIFSAYLNKLGKRAQQDFSALYRIGLNVHDHVWERETKAANDSSVVHDSEAKHRLQVLHAAFLDVGLLSKVEGAESKCSMPVNSASGSGEKRKADEDHPEAPSTVRQEKPDTGRSSALDETQRTVFSDDKAGELNCTMDTGTQFSEVQPEQPLSVEYYLASLNGVDDGYIIQFSNVKGIVPGVQPEQQVLPAPDVGEGSSGAPTFLEETEISHHTIKDPNHGALRRIGHGMNSDSNDYLLTPSEDSAMKIPVFVDHHWLVGGDNAGYPPTADGLAASRLEDNSLMFNEDDRNFLDSIVMEEHRVGGDNSGYPAGSATRILEEACQMFDDDGNNCLGDIDMEEPLIYFE